MWAALEILFYIFNLEGEFNKKEWSPVSFAVVCMYDSIITNRLYGGIYNGE